MNIFDSTSAAKTFPLASTILAAAADGTMKVDEIKHAIAGLMKLLEVKATQDNAKTQRIAKMRAAQADPKFDNIIALADAALKRLGFAGGLNAFAEDASMTKLNEAMTASGMSNEKRMSLKANLHALGCLD